MKEWKKPSVVVVGMNELAIYIAKNNWSKRCPYHNK